MCSRENCTSIHIVSDIPHIGKICNRCKSEFQVYLEDKDYEINDIIEEELIFNLKIFLKSEPRDHYLKFNTSINEYFKFYEV